MAITQNNVQNVKFLRNQDVNITRDAAIALLNTHKEDAADGTALLARYTVSGTVKTIVGFVYVTGSTHDITIFDTEGASADVEALRREINAKLGSGITSANTATAQLAALSGNDQSTSAETSVEGAKRYADELKNQMDYSGVTTGEGIYVTNVTQSDGIVSATTAILPSLTEVKQTGKPIVAVSEDKGQVAASVGTINAEFVDIADSGEKFSATTVEGALAEIATEIDAMDLAVVSGNGEVITAVSEEDGKVSASKTAIKDVKLTGYVKDATKTGAISASDDVEDALSKLENTIGSNAVTNADGSITVTPANGSTTDVKVHIKEGENVIKLDGDGNGIYTDIKIASATPSSTTVKEEYNLLDSNGNALGTSIKIYKDSHIVSITYITNSGDTHYQNLEYKYIDADGVEQTEYVDISSLVLEAEFASGLTIENHVARGVVDTTSEKDSQDTPVDFLTVGADGFKISGIKAEIDRKLNAVVENLDATVTDATSGNHVTITIEEVDGKLVQSGLTIEENDIASASDLAALSAKTITDVKSANGSVTVTPTNAADGTKEIDLATDASKIKMTGFTSTDALSGITSSSSITEAFKEVDNVITHNEEVTAAALTDLDTRLDKVEDEYISGITVNGSGVTVSSNVAALTLNSAPSTGAAATPIIVETSNNGGITLKFDGLDCGFYE